VQSQAYAKTRQQHRFLLEGEAGQVELGEMEQAPSTHEG